MEFFEKFNSLQELMRVLDSRPVNKVFEKVQKASHETGRRDFFHTETYEEAETLMRDGYKDILEEVKQGIMDHEKSMNIPVKKGHRIKTAVEGYIPHVPNMLMGLPNSMMKPIVSHQKVRAITIYYQMTVSFTYSTRDIIKAGICMLNCVNHLEKNGIRVRIYNLFDSSIKNNETVAACVKIKDFNEHLDIQKICFPIAHPAMLRRFGFRWLETNPVITDEGWTGNYGHPLTKTLCETLIRKHGMEKNDILMMASDIADWIDNGKTFDYIYSKYGFKDMTAA